MSTEKIDIIKLGGSVITDKQEYHSLRKGNLEKICETLSQWKKPFIIVHGAGSFGHVKAEEYSIKNGFVDTKQLDGITSIRSDMTELTSVIVSTLKKNNIKAVSFQTSSILYLRSEEQLVSFVDPISKALSLGLCPVLSGDVLFSEKTGFTIYSGDSLIDHLSRIFNVDNVVFVTDVDGLFVKDEVSNEISILEEIDNEGIATLDFYKIQDEKTIDVTGSMEGKIKAISSISDKVNRVIIVNGLVPERIVDVLNGTPTLCTLITSKKSTKR